MTVPTLAVSPQSPTELPCDVLVVGVFSKDGVPVLASDDEKLTDLRDELGNLGVTGARDEVRRVQGIGAAASIALVGLGNSVQPGTLRYAAGSAARQLVGVDSLVFSLPVTGEVDVAEILEGAAIGAYSYLDYRFASKESTKVPATTITVASNVEIADGAIARAATIAEAVHRVRDLVNAPPIDLYPETFADAVLTLAENEPVDVTVLAEKELTAGGYGGLLGVGSGSARGPRLVKISYSPQGASRHIALVGKGITFDTGGLSLKPPASMVGMKFDMTGAATVMAVVLAAARLAVPVRITSWLCLAENMPSGTAIRPNDVLRIRGGRTVEVLNTDAEGRLVLADGLVAASEEHPDAIIDVATLTGASIVALGHRYAGVMGADALVSQVIKASKAANELMWPMPLPEELRATLNTDIADIANAKIGSRAAGMLLAGVFLQEFIGKTADGSATIPWAHLDIAGTAENPGGGFGYSGKGATGMAVRTLLKLAEEISQA